jgi:hypothetical protein
MTRYRRTLFVITDLLFPILKKVTSYDRIAYEHVRSYPFSAGKVNSKFLSMKTQ